MTDEDVIRKLQFIVGGNVTTRPPRPGRKQIYSWSLTRREDVVKWLNLLQPHMGARRSRRIEELLAANQASPKGAPRKNAVQHGSVGMYTSHGCRCDECAVFMQQYRKANNARQREYKRRWYLNRKEGQGASGVQQEV